MSLFFLMCSERSGSNFITKLLNGHRDICGPSTKHIINPVARNLFRYRPLDKEENWNELLTDIHRLLMVDFSVWKKSFTFEELKSLATPGDIASLIKSIFMEEARANGKKHVFIKENNVYEFLPFLLINFPESKYIYKTRDPRDMALSWKKNQDHPGGVVTAARRWQHDQQNTLKNYDQLERINKAYLIRYEDLTAEPERYVREILTFMGLPFDEGIFDFYKDELTRRNSEKIKAWSNLARSVINNNSNKYQRELTEEEIKAIEKICYFEMKLLGYEPEFSKADLDAFPKESITELAEKEEAGNLCHRSEGVLENMKAKKIFYQKLL
jgi:hypothetical protein